MTQLPVLVLVASLLMWAGLLLSSNTTAGTPDIPIDFSHAGYGGGAPLPEVPTVLKVRSTGGDDTVVVQAALDRVATLPQQPNGFRGALMLMPGRYQIAGQLKLNASGIVLRGGDEPGETTIVATGLARRTLIEVGQENAPITSDPVQVIDKSVPAGGRVLTLASVDGFTPGQLIVVTRPSTAEWIDALGMDEFEGAFADLRLDWTPGSRDLVWDRIITDVDPAAKTVTLDAPITTALEQRYGGGTVARATGNAPTRHVGIEHLTLESEFDASRPHDEGHAWIAIALDHVEDAWVRDVVARHFVSSAVRVGHRGRRITIADSHSRAPVSEPGGYRRHSFLVEGQ